MRETEVDDDHRHDPFGSTRWSIVQAAGTDGRLARAALETLCSAYWLPVYGYVRSRVTNVDDAHDLTQAFFAEFLRRKTVAAADPSRGRFRAFLLTALKHFLVNEHARDTTLKRGGNQPIVSLDQDVAENRLSTGRQSNRTPEQEFERRWALALLEQVLERLAREQKAAGRERQFAELRPFLTGEQQETSLVDVAHTLKSTPQAIRAAIYRLRKRYRSLLRDEVSQTVSSADEVDDELTRLISAVSS